MLSYNNNCCKYNNKSTASRALLQPSKTKARKSPLNHICPANIGPSQSTNQSNILEKTHPKMLKPHIALQRLDSYISKSALIWDVVSGTSKCPIATDPEAMAALKTTFDQLWEFKPKDIKCCLKVLKRDHDDIHDRVLSLLNDGATSSSGSWSQRNAALYSLVCDTLDLTKNGNDLGFLEVVDESNGLAIYNLTRFRIREIKSSDPLARTIKLQMGIQHIKYIPKPHGVAQYFAQIEKHRSELAALPKPKIISDWEVTVRELSDLHPQFKSVAELLAIQRKILHTETTLEDCRNAFTTADIDHNIGGELHAKNQTKSRPNAS